MGQIRSGVLRLFIVMLLLCGSTVVVGQMTPVSDHVARLHLTDCAAPCWANIVPGQTTWDEAHQHIVELYPSARISQGFDNTYLVDVFPSDSDRIIDTTIRLSVTNDIVTEINIQFSERDSPTTADFMSIYGIPKCTVPAIVGVGWMTLVYPQIEASGNLMTPLSLIEVVRFSSEDWKYCQQEDLLRGAGGDFWKGFRESASPSSDD